MKDKQIQQLFDNYAQSLPQQDHLADKARGMAFARSEKKKWWLVPMVAAYCVVAVAVLFVAITLTNSLVNVTPSPTYQVYTSSQVTGHIVDRSDIASAVKVDLIDEQYEVIFENYRAYYFDDGQLAYIRASLGVSTEYGVVEVQLIAENNKFVRNDLKYTYDNYIYGQSFTQKENYKDGEYITSAYFEGEDMHFYIETMSNPNTELDVEKILQILC